MICSSDKLRWTSWVLVTSIGSAGGFMLGVSLGNHFFGDYYRLQFSLLLITVYGLLIGCSQWMVLQTGVTKSLLWIPATAIGFPLGGFVGFWINEFLPGFIYIFNWMDVFIITSIAGMLTGILQGIALGKNLAATSRWCLISGLSWGLGFATSIAININFENWYLRSSTTGALIGIVAGAISGAFIKSLISYPELEGFTVGDNAS